MPTEKSEDLKLIESMGDDLLFMSKHRPGEPTLHSSEQARTILRLARLGALVEMMANRDAQGTWNCTMLFFDEGPEEKPSERPWGVQGLTWANIMQTLTQEHRSPTAALEAALGLGEEGE